MTARLPLTPAGTGSTRIIGARLIDGSGAEPVPNAEIRIEGDRIAWAGAADLAPAADPDAVVVDVEGATILPGFFDTHVHLGMSIEDNPQRLAAQFPSETVLNAAATVRRTLIAGVTTARDLAGLDAGFRTAIANGTILGPRLHLAIMALSPTGGHTDFHLPNGTSVYPGGGEPEIDSIVDTDDDVRRTVRRLVRSGADVIKVCTTGGVSSPADTPHDLGVPERHVRLIVEETARRQSQPVAAHAQGAEGIKEAIRGGVASVEHGYEIDQEGIDLMLERGTYLVPTLSSALRVPDPAVVPDYLYAKKVRWSAIAREHVAKAIEAGVKVALGTDSGVCPHGQNLIELGHMVDLGLSPMGAIQAGTINAARLLRLDEHLGTIEAGKLADLVITKTDPLRDIHALGDPDTIDAVIQGGRVVKDDDGRFPGGAVSARLG